MPEEVQRVSGTRGEQVRVLSNGARWHRHVDQLQLRYASYLNTSIIECEQTNQPQVDTLQDGNCQNSSSTSSSSSSGNKAPAGKEIKNGTFFGDEVSGGIFR